MTNIELNQVRAQILSLQDNCRIYRDLQSLLKGIIIPGDKNKVELIAKAIRESYAIPLKYTHSHASLRALYEYSIEKNDTQLLFWTERQINLVLGPSVCLLFRNEQQQKKNLPTVTKSNRQDFLENYKNNMKINQMPRYIFREKENSFWGQQLKRLHHANIVRSKFIIGENNMPTNIDEIKLDSFAETLRLSFFYEGASKLGTEQSPQRLINDSKVSPYVIIPSLIECHVKRMNWSAVFNNYNMKTGLVFKKLALPKELLMKLFEKYGAPEQGVFEFFGIEQTQQNRSSSNNNNPYAQTASQHRPGLSLNDRPTH